jgi:RHS repeat-associated protein
MTASPFPCRSNPRFVGDPIDVVTGANTDVITDLAQRGPLPFRWTRYYNSARSNVPCALGWGHSHGFDCRLVRDLDGMRYLDPLGGAVGFRDPTDLPAAAGGMELAWIARDSYLIAKAGEPDQEFDFPSGADVARLARLREGDFTIELRWTPAGILREIVDSHGRLIHVTSDSAGRFVKLALVNPENGKEGVTLLAYEYDRAGNLVRATDLYQTTLSFAYDAGNRMTRRTDRRGYSFHFEYDDLGRCVHSRGDDGLLAVFLDYEPDANTTFVRRGDGGQWIYAYNDNKTVTQITDPYGHATRFILDESGRPVQEVDPNGNVTILHYDWRGRHDYRIDPNGRVLPTREANPNPDGPLAYTLPATALEWDFGRLLDARTIRPPRASDPLLDPFPAAVVNTVLGKTSAYDATAIPAAGRSGADDLLHTDDFGRPCEQVGPRFREIWKYDANGNLIEHRDRDGSVSRCTYESWNSLKDSIDPLGNVTSFGITVQGLVAKITDPGGTVTEYEYDRREKLVEVREAGRVLERYRRDAAGNIVEKFDASGRTQARWEIGPGNLPKAAFFASDEKHLFEYNANGRPIKIQTPAGVATFAYDEGGNLVADQRDGKGVVHEIELKGLVRTTYFDKFKVNYGTADNGDLVIEDPTGATHRFQLGRTGLILKHLANGSRELCQFDSEGRCRRKALLRGNGTSPWMHGYGYSGAGDLEVVSDTGRGTTKYRHDAAHRVLEETRPNGATLRFEHDRAGNLLRQPGLKDVVIGEANRLKQANGELCSYNVRCHLSERRNGSAPTRYIYDDLDMLVGCDLRGEPWTASYDGLCRRVRRTWRGETTTYYWDDFRLAAEVRHNGSVRLYVYADHKALAPFLFVEYEDLDAEPESGKRFYVFTNQVAAPIRVDDDTGRTVWSAQIGPYGTAEIDPASTVDMPLRFPGHYFDPETGLHYNRRRYYSPELGRYLQTDPAGLAGGINAYGYRRRPLTTVDIDGLGHAVPHTGKDPPAHQVGCSALAATLGADIDPDKDVREQLKAKADALQQAIDNAKKENPDATHLELPNGQKIDIRDGNLGPCISVAYDKQTGKTYYGQNMAELGGLHEPMQSRADALVAKNLENNPDRGGRSGSYQADIPGTHAEVQAVSAGMNDRDANHPDKPPPQLNDYSVYNQSTGESTSKTAKPKGDPMPCCSVSGCKHILGAGKNGGGAQDLS